MAHQLASLSTDVATQYSKSAIYNRAEEVGRGGRICAEVIVHGITVALIIIASLAAVGIIPAVTASITIIVLASVLLIANLIKCCDTDERKPKGQERNPAQIASAVVRSIFNTLGIVMGSLAITGVLPIGIVGITVAAAVGFGWILSLFIDYCCKGNEIAEALSERANKVDKHNYVVVTQGDNPGGYRAQPMHLSPGGGGEYPGYPSY
jgi:hypothetical protein